MVGDLAALPSPDDLFEALRLGLRLRRERLELALDRGTGVGDALNGVARFLAHARVDAERAAEVAEARRWN